MGGKILGGMFSGGGPSGLGGNIAGSGIGSIVLMVIVGLIEQAMAKKA